LFCGSDSIQAGRAFLQGTNTAPVAKADSTSFGS
jgi:hypothetical protein